MTDYEIILVGYGPIGQILALLLGRAGVSVAVVERHTTLFNMPRAMVQTASFAQRCAWLRRI